ncbi:DUF2897 family protein [Pseudoalteromonas fenneropenaei]|uniref:DUF2897 family protein n=1 Tax=Pseudoalteromonas fenneropenaei TaxID=1737459 RepID=A0ABV7CIK7_9GAMM
MNQEFETWQVILIIAMVLGVVWSNIALLKYANKFKFPSQKQDELPSDSQVESDKDNKKPS